MTDALLVAGSPVFTVDGEVRGELARDTIHFEIEEDTAGLRTLRARFVAFGPRDGDREEQLLYLDGGVFDFGRPVDISIGPTGEMRSIFNGFVSGIEAVFLEETEPEIVIYAEDRLMDLRMTRRTRTYENVTDADIAEEIASEHGLTAEVAVDGPTYDRVQQWNMSDLAFLRERARLVQAEIWFQDDTLYFMSRENRTAPELTLVRGNEIISLEVRADLAHQRTAVHVGGYDATERDVIDEMAGEDAIAAEVSGARTGPAVLKNAFGERISHRVREVPMNDQEAGQWARAEMLRRARAFVEVCGVTNGTADLTVGTRLTLERVGGPFEGDGYYTTRVRHTYDLSQGHRTHFEAQRATVNEGT